MKKQTTAIIPIYNEKKNIRTVVKKTLAFVDNIIVVDDGSNDDSIKTISDLNITILRHKINLGKGAALRTGCDYAIKNNTDLIIVIDGDAQHEPSDIPKFLDKLNDNDIVFGVRQLDKNMPPILRVGNWFLNKNIELLFGISLADTQCGFRSFTKESYNKIRWNSSDYFMESEMIAKAGISKLKYSTIVIKTIYNDRYKGTTVLDGFRIVFQMLILRLFNYK